MASEIEAQSRRRIAPGPVLVVEDEADLRELVCDYLRLSGHEAVGASHGAEAMSLLEHLRPCAIVLDLMMPVMDGWETLKSLQASTDLADIPVVIATAFPSAPHPSRESQVAATLRKPFSLDALVEAVERAVPTRQVH